MNDLLERCRDCLLDAVADGYPLQDAVKKVVCVVKKKLLDLAMGLIPVYQLAVTQKIREVNLENPKGMRGQVAKKMIERGVVVRGGAIRAHIVKTLGLINLL